jgi:glycosidase
MLLNTAPFMIYFGEEIGEKGMDEEGFSGRDGRTTIFDWWAVGSLSRLRKVIASGAYKTMDAKAIEEAGLSREEAEFFCRFAEVTRLAASDPAIKHGTTYDLCYCNSCSEGFDKNRHFVFLRDHLDHTVLVAANFSNHEANMKIVIPEHAFQWMEIPVTDDLYPGKEIDVKVAPMDATILTLID